MVVDDLRQTEFTQKKRSITGSNKSSPQLSFVIHRRHSSFLDGTCSWNAQCLVLQMTGLSLFF